ncbi:MAG: 4Fe-4S binding protein [Bacteroidota bacterium]
MKRTVIKIDEEKCTGCGQCVTGCHEGALQMIDGKARLISELFCDGLGACIGECPEGAIVLEERDAEPYDEKMVMERISKNGENTIVAHLKHLNEQGQGEFLTQGLEYLKMHNISINLDFLNSKNQKMEKSHQHQHHAGCPGSMAMDLRETTAVDKNSASGSVASELRQWPVQLFLVSPSASYFQNADVVLAADCVAFTLGNFHQDYLKGKSLAIACPKLDSYGDVYIEKLTALMDNAKINTLTVMIMEVPCCGGLLQMARAASAKATRKVPVKVIVVSIRGTILEETWM